VGQPRYSASVKGGVVATTLTTPIKMAKRPKRSGNKFHNLLRLVDGIPWELGKGRPAETWPELYIGS